MLTSDSEGGEKIPGTSSMSLMTLIGAEPVFSTVIVASRSAGKNDLMRDMSYCLLSSASNTVSSCSFRLMDPLVETETLGRMDDRNS